MVRYSLHLVTLEHVYSLLSAVRVAGLKIGGAFEYLLTCSVIQVILFPLMMVIRVPVGHDRGAASALITVR